MLHAECAHWSSRITAGPPLSYLRQRVGIHTYSRLTLFFRSIPPSIQYFAQPAVLLLLRSRCPPTLLTLFSLTRDLLFVPPRRESLRKRRAGRWRKGGKPPPLLSSFLVVLFSLPLPPLPHLLDLPRSLLADFLLSDFGRHRRLLELEELCPSAASGRPPCFLAPFTFLRPKPAGNMTGGGGRRYCSRLSREGNRWERLF